MITNIEDILNKLQIKKPGKFENHFYIIDLDNSDDYAKMYTLLNKNAINTEYPNFGKNTNNTTIKMTNYFEADIDNVTYNIFLIGDMEEDKYYVKIGEKA